MDIEALYIYLDNTGRYVPSSKDGLVFFDLKRKGFMQAGHFYVLSHLRYDKGLEKVIYNSDYIMEDNKSDLFYDTDITKKYKKYHGIK